MSDPEATARQFIDSFEATNGKPGLMQLSATVAATSVGQAMLRLCAERGIGVHLTGTSAQ